MTTLRQPYYELSPAVYNACLLYTSDAADEL